MSYVNADAVIPKNADTYITTDIHLFPTFSNAWAIAVSGCNNSNLAIPLRDPAMQQYINPHIPTVRLIAWGTFFSASCDSSDNVVTKSKPKNAKNIMAAP